jgi:hypothetical protein
MNSVNNTSEEFGVYLTSNKETLNMCKWLKTSCMRIG